MKKTCPLAVLAVLALALLGCQGYKVVSRNVFSDESGNLVTIDYGRSESEHVNTYFAPATGEEMEFPSKLVVKVRLPDGDTFTAWRCMNLHGGGTTYKTDDNEWLVWVKGFSCRIFSQAKEDPSKYVEVYRGILCESPKVDVEKDERWKVVKEK